MSPPAQLHTHTDTHTCKTQHICSDTQTDINVTQMHESHHWQLIKDYPHTLFKHTHSGSSMTQKTLYLKWEELLSDGADSFSECEVISCWSHCEGPMGPNWLTSNQSTVGGPMVRDITLKSLTVFCKTFVVHLKCWIVKLCYSHGGIRFTDSGARQIHIMHHT